MLRDDVMLAEPSSDEDEGFGVKSALEMRLLEHPLVFIREPEMQLHPIYTEESLHALIEDGDDEGERDTKRRKRRRPVSSDMLVSDMCAFKAANHLQQVSLILCAGTPRAIFLKENYPNACPSRATRGNVVQRG